MIKWLKSLFKPKSQMPPNHIIYDGWTIRLSDEYLNSKEFSDKLKQYVEEIDNDTK